MKKRYLPLLLLLGIICSFPAQAQMFSVGDNGPTRFNPYSPYIRAGFSSIDFTFEGNEENLLRNRRYDFAGEGLFLALESNGLNLDITMANKLTGQDDQSFFQMGLQFNNPFMLIRKKAFSFGIPLQIATQLTNVRQDNTNDEFAQTDLSAGLGALLQLRAGEVFGITTQAIPSYGFSSSSGGFFGGSVTGLNGKLRLNFYKLLFGRNISLGFDYKSNSYDIDGEELDYDLEKLSFTLGVSL